MNTVMDGIIIGGAGGAVAALTVWLIQWFSRKVDEGKMELFAKLKIHESLFYVGLTINPLRLKYGW
jgi:hypothetical protein